MPDNVTDWNDQREEFLSDWAKQTLGIQPDLQGTGLLGAVLDSLEQSCFLPDADQSHAIRHLSGSDTCQRFGEEFAREAAITAIWANNAITAVAQDELNGDARPSDATLDALAALIPPNTPHASRLESLRRLRRLSRSTTSTVGDHVAKLREALRTAALADAGTAAQTRRDAYRTAMESPATSKHAVWHLRSQSPELAHWQAPFLEQLDSIQRKPLRSLRMQPAAHPLWSDKTLSGIFMFVIPLAAALGWFSAMLSDKGRTPPRPFNNLSSPNFSLDGVSNLEELFGFQPDGSRPTARPDEPPQVLFLVIPKLAVDGQVREQGISKAHLWSMLELSDLEERDRDSMQDWLYNAHNHFVAVAVDDPENCQFSGQTAEDVMEMVKNSDLLTEQQKYLLNTFGDQSFVFRIVRPRQMDSVLNIIPTPPRDESLNSASKKEVRQ